MECKYDWNIVTRYGTYELIETLWNVNILWHKKDWELEFELIETLWNVNTVKVTNEDGVESRINRNIVECK